MLTHGVVRVAVRSCCNSVLRKLQGPIRWSIAYKGWPKKQPLDMQFDAIVPKSFPKSLMSSGKCSPAYKGMHQKHLWTVTAFHVKKEVMLML